MLPQAESCHTLAVWWYTQLHRPFYFLTGIWISKEQWIPLRSRCVTKPQHRQCSRGLCTGCQEASWGQVKDTSTLHFATAQPQLFSFLSMESHRQMKSHTHLPCTGAPQPQPQSPCAAVLVSLPSTQPAAPAFHQILGAWLRFSGISSTSWGWNWGLNRGCQQHPQLLGCAQEMSVQLRALHRVDTDTSPHRSPLAAISHFRENEHTQKTWSDYLFSVIW